MQLNYDHLLWRVFTDNFKFKKKKEKKKDADNDLLFIYLDIPFII